MWEQILDRLRTGADDVDAAEWRLSIDATVIRAHHHAAGGRHASPRDVPAERLAPTLLEVAERARGRAGAGSNYKDSGGCGCGPGDREGLGRSRGGMTTKVHLAADTRCRPVSRVTSAGQRAGGTRYDKREYVFLGSIGVASIRIWLRDPVRHHSRDTP